MSRYLVTGATGFLGAHVAQALRERGHDVVPYARGLGGGDILDGGAVAAAARGCEGAFHCAGKVSRRPEDAEELYRVHVEGTKNVLSACARAGVRRVVVASTSGIVAVSTKPDPVPTEDSPTPLEILARWPYYRSKLFAERAALAFDDGRLEVVCVNPSLILGPGDERGSSTEDVRLLLEGQIPAVPAGGLSFVDARDAAEAMILAMDRGRPRERYLVGACNVTVRDFFARIARTAGVRAPWLPMPRSPQLASTGTRVAQRLAARLGIPMGVDPYTVEIAQHFWYLDASKAERELGWSPRDPGVTLRDTVNDLRARGVVWPRDDGGERGADWIKDAARPGQ
jgi:dihydroflavonol-4-reductase